MSGVNRLEERILYLIGDAFIVSIWTLQRLGDGDVGVADEGCETGPLLDRVRRARLIVRDEVFRSRAKDLFDVMDA